LSKRRCDLGKRVNRRVPLAAFDGSHIRPVLVGQLSEIFLRYAQCNTLPTDSIANELADFIRSWNLWLGGHLSP
jgi:hypothetical protein